MRNMALDEPQPNIVEALVQRGCVEGKIDIEAPLRSNPGIHGDDSLLHIVLLLFQVRIPSRYACLSGASSYIADAE